MAMPSRWRSSINDRSNSATAPSIESRSVFIAESSPLKMMSNPTGSDADMKEFENVMKGYHDLVDYGKREIYKIESA